MSYTAVFERVEKKYLLTSKQREVMMSALSGKMAVDQYGESRIYSLYLDTWDSMMVRRSTDKPPYKEKLRLRSYGVPGDQDMVYLEIKKKVSGVVYKRRLRLTAADAMACIAEGRVPGDTQIARELDYMFWFYAPRPVLWLAYSRTAYAETEPSSDALRLTLDHNIQSRNTGLDLRLGGTGNLVISDDMYLMEIKTSRAIPLWLCRALEECGARPASFSKYGSVYAEQMRSRQFCDKTFSTRPYTEDACHVYSYV